MLGDYRRWLESELKLLGNASHHAYSFGQANMAKRALERLDAELGDTIVVAFTPSEADAIAAALETAGDGATPRPPVLDDLRARLATARA
jgi:predicted NAD-dependent protein-ADP-ribosyltransferase YbiA (DUF1768 family)